jgi:hypothetical protein
MKGFWIVEVKAETTKGVFEIVMETASKKDAMFEFNRIISAAKEEPFKEVRLGFIPMADRVNVSDLYKWSDELKAATERKSVRSW